MLESMAYELTEVLRIELGVPLDAPELEVLKYKVDSAILEVMAARNYSSRMSEAFIEKDMQKYRQNVHQLAMYDYNIQGAEGEIGHSENGYVRTYHDRAKCLNGVIPFVSTPS